MCKTTQIAPSAAADEKATFVVCSKGCPSIVPRGNRRVEFRDTVAIYDTFHVDDLSEQEKAAYWLTDDDWEEMRQDFFHAKRIKCPTVESSQPYRMTDRKAIIRYTRIVVLREIEKFRQSLRDWTVEKKRNLERTPSAKPSQTFPCSNCLEERVASLYRNAAKKNVLEAIETARQCEVENDKPDRYVDGESEFDVQDPERASYVEDVVEDEFFPSASMVSGKDVEMEEEMVD
ncbi:hypothetical protein IV203_003386 [Nitzschia inconspicua]|uniref:Uncharacterized protein n=1 Tax=Nitzschia inconspicua TaxID=303405 RepID=A0A9K3L3A7_9STRA|nr:hypothetical protein IV203_003386 [Nitzschia inconspicua]